MKYDPEVHHRRSIRLKEYDYANAGAYFVTVCAHGRECLFGEITDGAMQLNPAGEVVQAGWKELPEHYPHVVLDEFVIMPNHVHAIIILQPSVGAGLRPAQNLETRMPDKGRLDKGRSETGRSETGRSETCPYIGVPLFEVVRAFKSFSSRYINRLRDNPGVPVWQRNYYERIIRNDDELNRARKYIMENPMKWAVDKENPMNVS